MATFNPIIRVRGHAMTQSEVASTFNLGATQFAFSADTEAHMAVFERPVSRLINKKDYRDSFRRFSGPRNRPSADSDVDTHGEREHDKRWSSDNEWLSSIVADALFFDLPAGARRRLESGWLRVLCGQWE